MNWFQALSAVVLEHTENNGMSSYPQTREILYNFPEKKFKTSLEQKIK